MPYKLLPEDEVQQAPPPEEKSTFRKVGEGVAEAVRPYVRTGVNLTGLATGLPGDIAGLLNDWVAGPLTSAITGEKAVPYEKTPIGKLLPTSHQTTSALRSIAPDYLNPRGDLEDFTDSVINDTALLFSPGKAKLPFASTVSKGSKLLRAFTTSLGSNLAGKAVEDFSGGDKEKGTYTKLGSMFVLSLLNKKKAAQMAGELYKEAEASLPQGATQNAQKLEGSLNNLKTKMQKGTIAPSEKFIIDEADAVLSKIKNGEISVEEAWASKRSLNEKLNAHLFANPEKAAQARARKLASGIQHELSDVLEQYGKRNPKFGKNFQNAEEAFGTIAQSKFMTRFIQKHLKYSPVTNNLMHLFGSGLGQGIAGAGAAVLGAGGTTAAAAALAYPTAQLAYRISKSPVLRKHYLSTVAAAAAEDAVVFNRELEKLDNELQKDQKKDKFKFVD